MWARGGGSGDSWVQWCRLRFWGSLRVTKSPQTDMLPLDDAVGSNGLFPPRDAPHGGREAGAGGLCLRSPSQPVLLPSAPAGLEPSEGSLAACSSRGNCSVMETSDLSISETKKSSG